MQLFCSVSAADEQTFNSEQVPLLLDTKYAISEVIEISFGADGQPNEQLTRIWPSFGKTKQKVQAVVERIIVLSKEEGIEILYQRNDRLVSLIDDKSSPEAQSSSWLPTIQPRVSYRLKASRGDSGTRGPNNSPPLSQAHTFVAADIACALPSFMAGDSPSLPSFKMREKTRLNQRPLRDLLGCFIPFENADVNLMEVSEDRDSGRFHLTFLPNNCSRFESTTGGILSLNKSLTKVHLEVAASLIGIAEPSFGCKAVHNAQISITRSIKKIQ